MTPEARKQALKDRTDAISADRALFDGPPPKTPTHPESVRIERARKQMARAWRIVQSAVESGKLRKPSTCRFCSRPAVEAHHLDYSQPLHVIWLCEDHHDTYTAKRPHAQPRRTRALLGY